VLQCFFIRNPKIIYRPAQLGCWLGLKVGGVRFVVRGLEHLRPDQTYIFVANHQSLLDPPGMFVYLQRDLAFLAKKELYRLPIFNPGLYLIGCARIDRRNRERAIESIRQAADLVRRGRSFIVYAEGTRTPDGQLHPFKKGAFHLALEAGVPVVPVTIDGTYDLMPKGPIHLYPGTAHIIVHEPIDVAAYSAETVGELAETTRRIIQSAFERC
jgi:1-acyl-sn-glycerol-3-phosphate acyltransferase